jgi:ATP-binding cassette subfamily C (CFTR/MRP) protein 1
MDEATSSIDIKTEDTIQKALNIIMENSTVITIAHRIKTIIDYDKILVLDFGEIKEFDSPKNLIENNDSLFYELYKKSQI